MRIVIDIPREKYAAIQDGLYCGILDDEMYWAIKRALVLPCVRPVVPDNFDRFLAEKHSSRQEVLEAVANALEGYYGSRDKS